jgi:hypothetical protein
MAISFPGSPAKGDSYSDPGSNQRYTWTGTAWIGNAAGVRKVEPITQAAYSALASKDATTLYLVS